MADPETDRALLVDIAETLESRRPVHPAPDDSPSLRVPAVRVEPDVPGEIV